MPFLDGAFYGGCCQQQSRRWGSFLLGGAGQTQQQPSDPSLPASSAPPVIGAALPSYAGATTGSHLPQINHLPPLRASQCNQGAGKPLGHQGVKRLRQGKWPTFFTVTSKISFCPGENSIRQQFNINFQQSAIKKVSWVVPVSTFDQVSRTVNILTIFCVNHELRSILLKPKCSLVW